MQNIVIESIPQISGSNAEGIALLPGISGNGWQYEPQIIRSVTNIGKELPVWWDHQGSPIGTVIYSIDESIPLLKYKLSITSPNHKIVEGVHRVSIDANHTGFHKRCTTELCSKIIEGLELKGISITDQPSVIGASLNVIYESLQNWNTYNGKCDECKIEESEQIKKLEDKITTLETKLTEATTCKVCGKLKKL